ncbi:PASTA domain-containing protein [Actinocorallia sp. B10E7]|uniref:PASTA domain-containing protein n=1 Tax=Actinocorallia sp. B10E7 TaxID=3153558 RepID=UPI00325D374B
MDLAVGWRVPGYRDLRELGAGAFGHVVMAVDEDGDSLVAVRYLPEGLVRDERFREEFRNEAPLLAGLRSEHVVRVREYVEASDGAAVVMDLVDGVSLREVLAARGPLEPESALAVLKGSLLGLSAAHEAGVVHRNHRPENVLITAEGVTTLVDFGIAVRSGARIEDGGTPAYTPPERWQHGLVLPAGDIYAAAAVFFECLTGRTPYQADSVPALAELHLQAPIPLEDVPEAVRGLLRRGLAKDFAESRASGAEFAAELEAAAAASYGEDWEQRGLRLLAMAVAEIAVLALSEGEAPVAEVSANEDPPEDESVQDDEESAAVATAAEANRPGRHRLPSAKSRRTVLACAALVLVLIACLIAVVTRSSDDRENGRTPAVKPGAILSAEAATVTVPDVVGAAHADAENKVRAAGLVPYILFKQSLKHEPGTVIETDPAAGTSIGRDTLVGLVVAQRTPVYAVVVPDVRGSSYTEAEIAIRGVGLVPHRVDQEISDEQRMTPGEVVSTSPEAGAEVERGSRVTVYVAKASANKTVPVPNVALLPQDRAVQALLDAGLKPVIATRRTGDVPPGQIVSTDPKAGVRVAAGTSVTLYVAQAPPVRDVAVPNVAGSSYDAAAQVLRSAGLVPEHAVRETSDAVEGTAVGTDPPAGSTVKAGSKVTVYIAKAPPLTLSAAAYVSPPTAYARCDTGYAFTFSGSISVSRGPVTVTYRWIRSDGASGPVGTLRFTGTGPQTLPVGRSLWRMGGRDYAGWQKVQILTPNAVLSEAANFRYDCRRRGY